MMGFILDLLMVEGKAEKRGKRGNEVTELYAEVIREKKTGYVTG